MKVHHVEELTKMPPQMGTRGRHSAMQNLHCFGGMSCEHPGARKQAYCYTTTREEFSSDLRKQVDGLSEKAPTPSLTFDTIGTTTASVKEPLRAKSMVDALHRDVSNRGAGPNRCD